MNITRRHGLALLAAATTPWAQAAQKKSLADPMRLGAEQALVDCGLAGQFQRAFGRDTGVAVEVVPGNSAALIAALERGEFDASMTNAPELEAQLEKQGLAHDRRLIAQGDFVLVGPLVGKGKKAVDPAGLKGERDIALALAKLAETKTRFIGPLNGSGAYLSSLALWRAAKVAPAAPWYTETSTPKGSGLVEQAAAENAYALVERGVWLSRPNKALAVLVEGDPRQLSQVHVMRSFRVNHPAAKLFGQWVGGATGRHVAAGLPGWRPAPA